MEILIIKENSPEYKFMWNWIAAHPLNEGLAEPMVAFNDGEVWQYMGSHRNGLKTLHTFRHRYHPSTNERKNLTVEASKDMNEDDIETKFGSVLK
jgi:hypothetical protein